MLDGGPSRVQQSLDQRTLSRAEPVRRKPEPVQPPKQRDAPSSSVSVEDTSVVAGQRSPGSKRWFPVTLILVIAIACFGAWFFWDKANNIASTIDKDKYQALFLTSGQVYFGNLETVNEDYLKLSNVFYIQSSADGEAGDGENPQQSSDANMQLIKLGNELHGPEDAMIVNRDQVLFFENLKTDGRVTDLIKNYNPNGN